MPIVCVRHHPQRRRIACAAIGVSLLVTAAIGAAPRRVPARAQRFVGVSLSSGEFAGRKIPGIRGRDYDYPSAKDFAPFAAMGMNTARVPLRWRRLQPIPLEPLSLPELDALDASVSALTRTAALVIIDVHDYGSYAGRKLGVDATLDGALPDLWSRLAQRFRSRPNVAFGVMNEPHGMPAAAWRAIAERSVAAIRATGARNLVLVPGTRWSGAHSWTDGREDSNAAAMAGFHDPARNMLFEMHQYLDHNSSGTGSDCVLADEAVRRVSAAGAWLREQRQRGFLGEFGAPDTPACLLALDALLRAIDAGVGTWAGWVAWGAGSWWSPRYPLALQPRGDVVPAQLAVLRAHVAAPKR